MRRLLATILGLVIVLVLNVAPTRAGVACPTIGCGVPVSTTIGTVGEVDCYSFAGTALDVVSITANEPDQPQFNACWRLLRSGALVATECGGTRDVTLPTTDTYTIEVYDNGDDDTGSYDLGYTVVSDSAAAAECASTIACGMPVTSAIGFAAESDTYQFEAVSGDVVSVAANEAVESDDHVIGFQLYDPSGTSLVQSTTGQQQTLQLGSTGTYTVRVFENGGDDTGSYAVSVAFVSATASSCATAIGCSDSSTPTLTPRTDIDTFSFTTSAASETVRIIVSGAGGDFDPCWTIFAAGVSPGLATTVCSQSDVVLPNAGTHVIRVSDLGDDATGPYGFELQCPGVPTATPLVTATPTALATVTSTALPTVMPTSTVPTPTPTETVTPTPTITATPTVTITATPTATPQLTATVTVTPTRTPAPTFTPAPDCALIQCGAPVATTIGVEGEIDCYQFTGAAGDVVRIVESSPQGQDQFGTCWRLRRPDNAIVGTPECSGERNVTLPSTGTYSIEVYDNSAGGTGDATGSYHLGYSVVSDSPASCAVPIACGGTVGATIGAVAESDLYSFVAQAGEIATVAANDGGTSGIAIGFELYGPTGSTSLAQSTAEGRTIVLPQAGTYTIQIGENGDDGMGDYQLSFAIVSPSASRCSAELLCGETLSGTISPRTNIDTFELDTQLPAENVRITTTNTLGTSSACWTIFGALGAAPAAPGTPTPVCGQGDVRLPNAGTHVVRVTDLGDDATGSYGIGLQCLGTATPTPTASPTPTSTLPPTTTPTPTLTPTATSETPTPTPTPAVTTTATFTAAAITPSATPQVHTTASPIPPPRGLDDPKAAKAALRCQKTLLAASAKLVATRTKRLDACAAKVHACEQTKGSDPACRAKAGLACASGLAKLGADEAKMRTTVAKACNVLRAGERGSAAGLGFDTPLAPLCPGGLDFAATAACIGDRSTCGTDRLATVTLPRTGELFRLAGAASSACLADFGGGGGGAGDPKAVGGPVLKCAKAIAGAARGLAAARLGRTANCVNAVFKCIQTPGGDSTCITKAGLRCGSEAGKIGTAEAKLALALNTKCLAVPFPTLASAVGLDLDGLAATCTALGVGPASSLPAYQECLRRAEACETVRVIAAAAPRAGELLLQVGRPLYESYCPVP